MSPLRTLYLGAFLLTFPAFVLKLASIGLAADLSWWAILAPLPTIATLAWGVEFMARREMLAQPRKDAAWSPFQAVPHRPEGER